MSTKEKDEYEVIVENIGTVHRSSLREASRADFETYVRLSRGNSGRAAGSEVTIMKNGEIIDSYSPTREFKTVHVLEIKLTEQILQLDPRTGQWSLYKEGSGDHELTEELGVFKEFSDAESAFKIAGDTAIRAILSPADKELVALYAQSAP